MGCRNVVLQAEVIVRELVGGDPLRGLERCEQRVGWQAMGIKVWWLAGVPAVELWFGGRP